MTSINVKNPDKIDWMKTFAHPDFPKDKPIGVPPFVILLDGTFIKTVEESPPDKPQPGRPRGSGPRQRAAALVSAMTAAQSKLMPEALPATAGADPEESEETGEETGEKAEVKSKPEEPMPSKPRTQTLPGTTGSAGPVVVREIPYEAIHEAIEQNLFADSGVELRIHYKNQRGVPISLGTAHVAVESLITDLETWVRDQWGGGCFRVDARDPVTKKRALPIPVFEINIHGPQRLHPNGTVVPPGQTIPQFSVQGSPPMSGFQNPWGQPGFAAPVMPGNISGPQLAAAQSPWTQAPSAYGPNPGVHHVPVMSMPPDAIAMTELQKAQSDLKQERRDRAREAAEFNKKLEAITATLQDQRLKEEDRARQIDAQQMRDQLRRMEENFRAQLDAERNKRPAFDLGAIAAIVTGVVPVFTAMITTRNEQTSKSLELQANGVNNLMKATLERTDSKWVEKLISVLPVLLPAIGPLFKVWAEQKSPAAQADLVATLSENHLTALSMMAKLMNEMVPAGPEQPAWVPVFQQMVGTVVASIDSMVKSNKNAVGIPTQSQHFPQPRLAPPAPALTPAQMAMGQSYPQPSAQPIMTPAPQPVSFGAQIAQLVANSPEVPLDLKTPPFLKLIEDLHNQAEIEQVAVYFANHLRDLEDNVPQMLQGIWTGDEDPEKIFQALFSNLPIWTSNQPYTLAFIKRTVDILTTPAEAPTSMPDMQFFTPAAAAPVA